MYKRINEKFIFKQHVLKASIGKDLCKGCFFCIGNYCLGLNRICNNLKTCDFRSIIYFQKWIEE